jgi:uncharacterized protein YneF (UPF0154 family)
MPTETEELKIKVTLDDTATAQLSQIRSQVSQLENNSRQPVQRTTKEFLELDKAVGSLSRNMLGVGQSAMNFAKVIGPWPVAIATLGYELIRHQERMRQWAGAMMDINNAAQRAGMSSGVYQNIVNQMERSGISAQAAGQMLQNLTRTITEAGRAGSETRQRLIVLAGPQHAAAMLTQIAQLGQMRDATDRTNKTREFLLNVAENKYRETNDRMKAMATARMVAEILGAEALLNQKKEILKLDQRTQDNMKWEEQQQYILNDALVTEAQTRERIGSIINANMASYTTAFTKLQTAVEQRWADRLEEQEAIKRGDPAAIAKMTPEQKKVQTLGPLLGGATVGGMAQGEAIRNPAGIVDFLKRAFHFQHGGVVTQPTMGLVGEAGPEAVIPLGQFGVGQKHTESVDENTKQLRMLNDQMEAILNPRGGIDLSAAGIALGGQGTGGGYGGGRGGTGPIFRPGIGPGATPAMPTTPGFSAPTSLEGAPEQLAKAMFGTGKEGAYTLGDIQGAVTGGGEGGINRQQFVAELNKNPALREKVIRIAYNEQGSNPEGTQAVIESMMNRAQVRGTTLEQQARWHESEGGYYAQGNMGSGMNAASRAVIEQGLGAALNNSNISNYATDNSSGDLARRERATGAFVYQKDYTGETFFSPGTAEPGQVKRYQAWRSRVAQAAQGRISPAATAGFTPTAPGIPTTATTGIVSTEGVGSMEGDDPGSGRGHGGRFNVPAGSGFIGEQQTVTLKNGVSFIVNKRAAAQFEGFYNDLIDAGAPIPKGAIGGYGTRGNPSQHPIGLATDWLQSSRDVTRARGWMTAHADLMDRLESKWGMSGGEHWDRPDTGHFSIDTIFGAAHLAAIAEQNKKAQAAVNAVLPPLSAPPKLPAQEDRASLDAMLGNEVTKHDVDTSGTITIKNSPKRPLFRPKRPPVFKDVGENRQSMMHPADDGPKVSNPAADVPI